MYSKEKLIEVINAQGQYIDAFMLDAFIKNWKLEAIYEDENGTEFFDDEALEKIKYNLSPNSNSQNVVIEEVQPQKEENSTFDEDIETQEEQAPEEPQHVEGEVIREEIEEHQTGNDVQVIETAPKNHTESEVKNVTLDITNQTLGVLAEAIAGKITTDIAKYLKNTDFLQEAMEMGAFKKDNEILAKKVQEIISDNKALVKKIQEIEHQKNEYIKVFGNIYIKKNVK